MESSMFDLQFDPDPFPGCNAYWLRVLQHDGAQAWSSPVFATYASAPQV